jgi:hypothetical protein
LELLFDYQEVCQKGSLWVNLVIIKPTLPTTPLHCKRTEVGHYFPCIFLVSGALTEKFNLVDFAFT